MATWIQQTSPTANLLRSVFGLAPNDVYACGDAGTVVHWNGTAWSLEILPPGLGGESFMTVFTVGGDVFVFSFAGRVVRKSGGVWTDLGFAMANGNSCKGAWGASLTEIWAVQANGVFQHSTNAGASWSLVFTDASAATGPMRGFDASDVYMVGSASPSGIFFYNGTTWAKTSTPMVLADIWPDSKATGYAVGVTAGNNIYRFTQNGAALALLSQPDALFSPTSLFGLNATTVYVVGNNPGSIFRVLMLSSGGAMVDDVVPSALSFQPQQVWVAANGSAFAVGSGGIIVSKIVPPPSLSSAVAISTNTVQATLTAAPLAKSQISTGDALNPATWAVARLDTGASFDVMAVTQVSPTVFNVTIYELFAGFNVTHQVSVLGLVDPFGTAAVAPLAQNFAGVLGEQVATPAAQLAQQRQVQDLLNLPAPNDASGLAGTLVIGSSGDYVRQWGVPFVKKMYFRRLTTKPRAFFHLPNYGLGLSVNEPLPAGDAIRLRAQVESQLKLEPETDTVQAPITLDRVNQIVTIDIQATLLDGSTVEQAIPLPGKAVTQ